MVWGLRLGLGLGIWHWAFGIRDWGLGGGKDWGLEWGSGIGDSY